LKKQYQHQVMITPTTPTRGDAAVVDESAILKNYIPEGYELVDTKESAKMIKGIKEAFLAEYITKDPRPWDDTGNLKGHTTKIPS